MSDSSASSESKKKPRFWNPAWWLPDLKKADRQDSCQRISESSAPKPTYYVLIVLSTLIASYGLVSNSTATVIGAMIVAPLMGPILGLALGTVLGDARMFYRSLLAEFSGVFMVIATGFLVALVVGPQHIDFSSSEIANRTSPTLYDFAIGLAAGLAGGYCTVHPGLQSSVAGVAIAVALVPPLSVTGLCTAGWLSNETTFSNAFGSFMLFFTNLVTIELASAMVFFGTGFRQQNADHPKGVWRKILTIKAILILLTGWFLTGQLRNLLRERFGLSTSRQMLVEMLKDIPGAQLDSLQAKLQKKFLVVTAVVGSRQEIKPPTVARFEKRLGKSIQARMPDVTVRLVVRTVNSTYASSTGYLFEPSRDGLTDEQRREQTLDTILTELVEAYPGVELVSFHTNPAQKPSAVRRGLTVTLSTPYVFTPRLVKVLQEQLTTKLAQEPLFADRRYDLLVRSAIIHNSTSDSPVALEAPEVRSAAERAEAQRESELQSLLTSFLEIDGDITVTEVHIRKEQPSPVLGPPVPAAPETTPTPGASPESAPTPSPTPVTDKPTDAFEAQLVMRSPNLVGLQRLAKVREQVQRLYEQETGYQLQLSLDAQTEVGGEIFLDYRDKPAPETQPVADKLEAVKERLSKRLNQLLAKIPGSSVDGQLGLQEQAKAGHYRMYVVVTTPKPLENKTVLAWQKELLKSVPEFKSLELRLENRLGRTIRLTPVRR